jgi:uncharacterized FlaG/YvyC family protein
MNISSIGPSTAPVPAQPAAPQPLDDDQRALVHAVHAVNAAEMFGQDHELTFAFSRNSREAVVRIIDRKTNEVVEQIPGEHVLRLAEELKGDC